MQAALLPDRGVVKVAGDDARRFLNGLVTADIDKVAPDRAQFGALLTPQGKIIADFIVAEAPAGDGGGFFLDAPRALVRTLIDRLSFYKLRAKVTVEDFSDRLAVLAVWDGSSGDTGIGLPYPDPRLPKLGLRIMLEPPLAEAAANELGATLVDPSAHEAHRIRLGVPRGGLDFIYGEAFPHETDMDQLAGVDFAKGCYVGQEVVSRIEHRGTARSRVVPVTFDGFGPEAGLQVSADGKPVGTMGSSAEGRGLALLRLDRAAEARTAGVPLIAGGIVITPMKPDWARFAWPASTAAE